MKVKARASRTFRLEEDIVKRVVGVDMFYDSIKEDVSKISKIRWLQRGHGATSMRVGRAAGGAGQVGVVLVWAA